MEWSTIPVTKPVKKKFVTGMLSCAARKNTRMTASDYIEELLEVERNANDCIERKK